jgi:tagatose 6-phosphate kinase
MILSVTLNPVVDTTFFVESMRPIYRTEASQVTHITGGKGTNVTRALYCLGEEGRVLVALAGKMGRVAADVLSEEGLNADIAWISGETRLMITVVDDAHNQRAFFAPNTPFAPQDTQTVKDAFDSALANADIVALCGSSPAREADPLFTYIVEQANRRGLPTLLDSSGGGLKHGLQAAPSIVKVNQAEAEGLLGRPLPTDQDRCAALDELRDRGAQWAIITMGERGAFLGTETGEYWHASPPGIKVVNPIGCGDAMTAGLLLAIKLAQSPSEALCYATAVAAANALSWDACLFDASQIQELLPRVKLSPIRS